MPEDGAGLQRGRDLVPSRALWSTGLPGGEAAQV